MMRSSRWRRWPDSGGLMQPDIFGKLSFYGHVHQREKGEPMLAKFKMSQKILGGFIMVAVILGLAILYMVSGMKSLAALQDEGAGRADDAIEMGEIMERLAGSYSVIADAVINRNLEATRREFAELKAQSKKDIARVLELVDTDEERRIAKEFGADYSEYLAIFEDQMFPVLEKDKGVAPGSEEGISNLKKIRELDEKIDVQRGQVDDELEKLFTSLHEEMNEGDKEYDAVSTRTILVATIIGIVGLVIALAIGFLLTSAITRPINEAVKNMTSGAEQVSGAAGQVASSSQSLAEGASEQAASLEETSASMEEMTSMTRQNADNANQADTLMREALSVITAADKAMDEMSRSMEEISKASDETSKIVKTIDEISFQTNLLALNAAVEAARAGEAGAGFAVVADEVRNLAMRAAEASKNTAALIEGTVVKVNSGKEIVSRTNAAFKEVAESSSKVGSLVGEISAASKEQSTGFSEIGKAISQMDEVTQRNSATAEESAAAAEELNAQSEVMMASIMDLRSLVEGVGSAPPVHRASGASRPVNRRTPAPVTRRPALAAPAKSAPKAKKPEEVIPMDDEEFEDF
ncbi:MAG: hypothetical protein KKG47_02585 [Proteobacteria bacterium]|nr:hypothetical protein [Pseudomonadota bacterium]MBU1738021.1 hypothetical protein [Pseudomonadota bacterium]